jgi:hypothetical protein
MQRSKLYAVLLVGAVLAIPMTAASAGNPTLVSLQAVVDGTSYNIQPAQPIPVKPKDTFTLTLTGTVVDSSGTTKGVPIDATFTVNVGKDRVTLSNPTANGVDVTVNEVGPHGNQLKYTVTATGYDMRPSLATGYINLH